MDVTGIIVTKGDQDLGPCLETWPENWNRLIWDNGRNPRRKGPAALLGRYRDREAVLLIDNLPDLSVYGRYAAIEYAADHLVFVQDDDVVVSDPESIASEWEQNAWESHDHLVANMPPEFRPHYPDACLLGFGACFHRDAPARAFQRYARKVADWACINGDVPVGLNLDDPMILRECDRLFTVLTPRVLVDVPKTDRDFASDPDRLWRAPEHHGSTKRMLELARKVRDA